jgi:hypothetical protein
MSAHLSPRNRLLLLLLALPFIVASQCVVLFSSGDSDDDDKDKDQDQVVVATRTGNFANAPVEGMAYQSGAIKGVTGPDGEFSYVADQPVQFALGDIELGSPVAGRAVLSTVDLVPGGDDRSAAVINIARLLQSLDATPGDAAITIPAAVLATAVRDNPAVAAAIEDLDFEDETAFVNSASQLLAVLTADYPHTATLVDAETAREQLRQWQTPVRAGD